jgi:hypothetical protein
MNGPILTVNDLTISSRTLSGKSTIGALMATRAAAPAVAELQRRPNPTENPNWPPQSLDSLVLKTSP